MEKKLYRWLGLPELSRLSQNLPIIFSFFSFFFFLTNTINVFPVSISADQTFFPCLHGNIGQATHRCKLRENSTIRETH